MKKIQYFTLRYFLGAMITCAFLALFLIWKGPPDTFTVVNKIAFTAFISGLASFLIWIVTIILEIRDRIVK